MENKTLQEVSLNENPNFEEQLGKKVADTLNRATRKVNKLLKQHGYEVTVDVQFRQLEERK